MSTEYVGHNEIEAHEAAMQRVVEDEKEEQEAIDDKKKRAIEEAQRVFDEAMKAAEDEADQELKKSNEDKEEKLAAMQRDFECLPLLRQVYHEAPDDVFELIVLKCCDVDGNGWGRGGLNSFRLANKRLKQVVESCTTRLTNLLEDDRPDSLPIPIIQRCGRIDDITCLSHNLRSLEGCPDGIKWLYIGNAPHLSDLSPLVSCSIMRCLIFQDSSITDILVVASIPLLNTFTCQKRGPESPSIKDLSPLSSCSRLKNLDLFGNHELKDLSSLSACTTPEFLEISACNLIASLAPLSNLKSLKELYCHGIDPETSLLPLVSCTGLKELFCRPYALDLEELRRRRPQLIIVHHRVKVAV